MNCPHGRAAGIACDLCGGPARVCLECSRLTSGRCWRHSTTVIVPPYTFRPFEPIDSTIAPAAEVITPVGIPMMAPAPSGLGWAPPPAIAANQGFVPTWEPTWEVN